MTEMHVYWYVLAGLLAIALLSALSLIRITAPYGRFSQNTWGRMMPSSIGWVVMETPACLGMVLWFCLGSRTADPMAWVFLALWQCHYAYRAFIFPFRRRGGRKPMPIAVVAMGMGFNSVNTWLIGRWQFGLGPALGTDWQLDPRFIAGCGLFFAGMAINRHSDAILRRLRAKNETGYHIPFGGLYRWVSAPNYLGELVEWTGWALLTWSPGGLAFALFTAANLVPRAVSIHRWYRREFPEYPQGRKAIFPGVL